MLIEKEREKEEKKDRERTRRRKEEERTREREREKESERKRARERERKRAREREKKKERKVMNEVRVQGSIVAYYIVRKNTSQARPLLPGRYKITIHKDGYGFWIMCLPYPGAYDVDYEPYESKPGDTKTIDTGITVTAKINGVDYEWKFSDAVLTEMQTALSRN
jgi:hypothetical protein